MAKNPDNKRSSRIALQQELFQLLTGISQKEEFAELKSAASVRQEPGLGQASEGSSGEDEEKAFLQLSLKSISQLAELSQSTGAWLDRLENVRATVAAETRELKRLREEIEFTQLSLEEEAKSYEQQRQRLEAETNAAHECSRQERERRENEEREYREKLNNLREENERLMALDQQRAQQQFMLEMQARERASREKLHALEKELERREEALRDEEEEWTHAMREFEKLSFRRGKRPGPNIEQPLTHAEQDSESLPIRSHLGSLSAFRQGGHGAQPVPAASESVAMEN